MGQNELRVLAMACRTVAQDDDPARREKYQVQEWQIPIVEIVSEDHSGSAVKPN